MNLLDTNDRSGEYPNSYYAASTIPLAPFPTLAGDTSCEVCVVGGGYTGLSAALHLAELGYDVVLLEAQRVGFGASGRNGGQVGSGQRREQDELERLVGKEDARHLWELAEESKETVRAIIDRFNIECGYKPGVLHAELKAKNVPEYQRYVDKLRRQYDYDQISYLDKSEISDALGTDIYAGGTMDWGAGHLHPLKYALGLARASRDAGVRIYESTRVETLKSTSPAKLITKQGVVTAKYVVLGCNGYLGALEPTVAKHVMPINNFIIATEPLGKCTATSLIRDDVAVADSKFVVNYYRLSEDRRLLFGGGESYGYKFPADITRKARTPMLEVFPQLADTKIEYSWGGTLAITMSRMPDFRRVAPHILSASGYSGHGVAMATLAGKIMAQAINGQARKFDVFSRVPIRRFPGGSSFRSPLLVLAMLWYGLRDRL